MEFKERVETILSDLKNEKQTDVPSIIPVLRGNEEIARLRVITKTMLEDDGVIELLAKWRSENQDAFPSQFTVTHEGTKRWGKAQLLDLPGRILFFLETLDGKPYGHIGLFSFNYEEQSCEIDNVVRGEEIQPGSMTDALRALIAWSFENLQLKNLYLTVFADNERAIRLYRRLGFVDYKIKPLKKITEPGVIKFVDMDNPNETPDRNFLVMKLEHFIPS